MGLHPAVREPNPHTVIRRLHGLVTYGPWDLDIAWAMAAHGYDAVKWAEGQGLLAELVSCDPPEGTTVAAAMEWYAQAAAVAQRALANQPYLLGKLGLAKIGSG
jgi:glutathione S-transferase